MKNENIRIRHVIQRSLDIVLPLTMMYMFYIILHGHLSPGGGFQGGVLVVGVILMLYFANGYTTTARTLSFDLLHEAEGVASVAYVALAMMGIAAGAQFCENILYQSGNIGDLYSGGTIFWMNLTVGIKVITGIGSITLLMLSIVNQKN
ncbi:MAG: MnhB domain-containing protein [Candidatus Limivicinus sp.]|jgi:multicomponent Na+:H+ antiporter subunit B